MMTVATTQQHNVPALRFPEFSGEWEGVTISELSEKITSGSRDWAQFYALKGDKFIRMTNLQRGEAVDLDLSDLKFVSLPVSGHEGARTSIHADDILISITAELGKIGIVPDGIGDSYINQHTALVRPTVSKAHPRFLAQNLARNSNTKKFNRLNDAGAKAGLNLGTISNFLVHAPTLPEQQKIAAFLSSVDRKIEQLTCKKSLLEQYKKGMMQKLFSQQLRFKDSEGNDFPDWEEKRLGELGETFGGLTGKTKESFGVGEPYIQYMQIFSGSKIDITGCGFVEIENGEKQNRVQYGDVFFTTSSETPMEIGTASALLDNVEEMYLNSFCFGYRPDLNLANPNYLQFAFREPIFRKKIVRLAQGSTRFNMSKVALMKISVELPSLLEQKIIADFLSAIDQKIDLIATEFTHAKTFKKGLLQQMFI
ncbi:MAG: restriction endonuclease subunit S [Robiginitomaculum sp.]|nr:restriction endonuclease subunit S [Robiginitomaculum sp.]